MTQPKIERILFATDFLESSRLALDYAVAIAHHFKAAVILIHAVLLSPPAREAEMSTLLPSLTRKDAKQRLEAFVAKVRRTGLEVETCVEDGLPCEMLLNAVSTQRADLLVLGTHGVHRGIDHLVIGSNTEKLLLSASCPTLTVGAHVLGGVDLELNPKEILYFSDFTPEATAAAPYALFLGREFKVPVDVCQLMPAAAKDNPAMQEALAEQYCDTMRTVIPGTASPWCTPAFQLERGLELDQILDRAASHAASLIVLGVKTQTQLGRHVHTSFAYQLLANARCPVLSVRADTTA